jgi:hypothetical protein
MKNRIISVILMTVWGVFFSCAYPVVMWPPRHLTFDDVVTLLLIPVGAFFTWLPSVPIRWFVVYGILFGGITLAGESRHILGTLQRLGWDDDFRAYLLPAFMFVCVVMLSLAVAWLRQLLHRWIAGRFANISIQPTGLTPRG